MGYTHRPSPATNEVELVSTVGDTPTFGNANAFRAADSSPRASSPELRVGPRRPWYKTPSPMWLFPMAIVTTTLTVATIAPRTELYIKLACNELHPDYLFPPPPALINHDKAFPSDPQTLIFIPSPPRSINSAISIPGPNKMCNSDPEVQAAIAKLQTILTTSMGVLSCITTGSWSQLSDRVGRTRVLAIAGLGILFTDLVLILVAFYADVLPGGYRFLIVGNIIDGALGGFSTASATSHAYISDTVDPASRSRTLSLYTGAAFTGIAIGPTLAALLTEYTQDLLAIFYVATAFHLVSTLLFIFAVPESLGQQHRAAALEKYNASLNPTLNWFGSLQHMVINFARPLAIFVPRRRHRGRGWDWSLTLIGVAFASAMLSTASHAFGFQYALSEFGWGTAELGYLLTIAGISRATHLLLLFPLLLKVLQVLYRGRKHAYIDLFVVRLSLGIEVLGYIALGLIATPKLFAVATCWLSLGAGFAPSIQSLALALHQGHADQDRLAHSNSDAAPSSETGRLFGALSVLQSLTSQIVGPSLFGLVFIHTIGGAPRAIFWVNAGCVAGSLFTLGLVRLGREDRAREEEAEEEESLSLL